MPVIIICIILLLKHENKQRFKSIRVVKTDSVLKVLLSPISLWDIS